MPKIIMLKGLPSSSKTTWANEQCKKGNFLRVSKDDLREMLGGYSPKKEKTVLKLRNMLIRQGIKSGQNVIVDDTNFNPKHERTIKMIAKELGVKMVVNDSFLDVSPEECIKRDLKRGDKAVGASVIWEMYYKYIAQEPIRKLEKDNKPRVVLCDLDGTLCLNTEGRSYFDMARVEEDEADPFVGCIIDALYNYGQDVEGNPYPRIILVSGRSESARKKTEDWLNRNMIPFDDLFLRREGDNRKDAVVKEEIYREKIEPYYAVLGVIDDRNSVCREWRKLGLRVLQTGNPEVSF